MREIKFRAWDKGFKKMLDWEAVGKLMGAQYFDSLIEEEKIILLQYTGLKDKNGKELYEGDILRCKYQEKEINVIEWHGNGYWMTNNYGEDYLPVKENMEIIGNIYENKELLNENKNK